MSRSVIAGLACAMVACVAVGLAVAAGEDKAAPAWPQFRGPDNNGISAEKDWSADALKDPKVVWKASVGSGYSQVAVADGKAYTMGNADDKDTVYCFDAEKGTELWKQSYPCKNFQYPGPRSTPTVADGKVYTVSGQGDVCCFDGAKGTVLWSKQLAKDTGVKPPQWGFASSAIVLDKTLLVNLGTMGVALDLAKGDVVWKTGTGTSGYATPVAFKNGEKTFVAMFGATELAVVSAKDGSKVATFGWKTSYDCNAPEPVVADDKIFITSGYGKGCAMLQFDGKELKELWQNKKMASHFSSPVLIDGCLYGNNGNAGGGSLVCMDAKSGDVKWSEKMAMCSVIAADGKLIGMTEKGELFVADAKPDGFKSLASAKVLDNTCWTAPTLSGGRLYVRNDKGNLLCIDVKAK